MLRLWLVGRKKEKETKREKVRDLFFPRVRLASLAVPHRIFMAVRCN
jgi:hypothetical protein